MFGDDFFQDHQCWILESCLWKGRNEGGVLLEVKIKVEEWSLQIQRTYEHYVLTQRLKHQLRIKSIRFWCRLIQIVNSSKWGKARFNILFF